MGTGLGLSTTLAIVRATKGSSMCTAKWEGTTFRIYIPATGTGSGCSGGRRSSGPPDGKRELILIIDDEAAIREITSETLQAYGYKAMTASDGAERSRPLCREQGEDQSRDHGHHDACDGWDGRNSCAEKDESGCEIIAASGLDHQGTNQDPVKLQRSGLPDKALHGREVAEGSGDCAPRNVCVRATKWYLAHLLSLLTLSRCIDPAGSRQSESFAASKGDGECVPVSRGPGPLNPSIDHSIEFPDVEAMREKRLLHRVPREVEVPYARLRTHCA